MDLFHGGSLREPACWDLVVWIPGGGNMEEIYSGVPVLTDWRASLVEK